MAYDIVWAVKVPPLFTRIEWLLIQWSIMRSETVNVKGYIIDVNIISAWFRESFGINNQSVQNKAQRSEDYLHKMKQEAMRLENFYGHRWYM